MRVLDVDAALQPQADQVRTALEDVQAMTATLTGYLMAASDESTEIAPMDPQKEIEEGKGAAYDMERRLLALKNAYAENVDQKRDGLYAGGLRPYGGGRNIDRELGA